MGTGAVVRAGHGRGTAWIWRVLRVEMRSGSSRLALSCSLEAKGQELTAKTSYAESHLIHHPLHAARGRARSPVCPQGEQRCDSLDREHLRARRVPDLAAAGAYVLGAAFRARLQVPRGHAE